MCDRSEEGRFCLKGQMFLIRLLAVLFAVFFSMRLDHAAQARSSFDEKLPSVERQLSRIVHCSWRGRLNYSECGTRLISIDVSAGASDRIVRCINIVALGRSFENTKEADPRKSLEQAILVANTVLPEWTNARQWIETTFAKVLSTYQPEETEFEGTHITASMLSPSRPANLYVAIKFSARGAGEKTVFGDTVSGCTIEP
jgi:hypothetical protein